MTASEHAKQIKRLKLIIGFKIPVDGFMTALLKRQVIDIIRLDQKLMKAYKYHGSMDDFIEDKFGKEALEIINENLLNL